MKLKQIALAAAIAATGNVAFAQSSSVTIYGNIDQNITYLQGYQGKSILALEDGGYLKSRFGFKGEEDLGGGLKAKFNLESGGTANNGAFGSSSSPQPGGSLFDRQAWVGLSSSIGDFKFGLQNTATFYRGDYIDYTSRTLGSVVNAFIGGFVPSRYANDVSYVSPRVNGVLFEAHRSIPGNAGDNNGNSVTQLALDYLNGPFRVGYSGNWFQPLGSATYTSTIKYDNFYANYDYGSGKIYAVYIKTNAGTNSSGTQNVGAVGLLTNLGATGYAPGDFTITQISADYRVSPSLRVGTLYGKIKDNTGAGQGAQGGSIGAYYDLSKRTMLYSVAMSLNGEANSFNKVNGSAGLSSNYSGSQLNGLNQTSFTVGVLHRF